jgi:chaperone modulatory protein CbpM
MRIELTEVVWLEEQRDLTLAELAELSGLSEPELRELETYGAIAPVDAAAPTPRFAARSIVAARTACRLRNDFELGTPGLAVALALLERIGALEAELRAARAQLPSPRTGPRHRK